MTRPIGEITLSQGRLDAPTVPQEQVEQAIKYPKNFAWFCEDDDRMFKTWSLGPIIKHRDSDAMQRANAKALRNLLAIDPSLEGDYEEHECNHWAVGHVTHLSFRAVEEDGSASRIMRIITEWFRSLEEDYPCADEDLYSEEETEEANEVWANCYNEEERIAYIRRYRDQFDFRNMEDLMACVRGKYFAGDASELLY